MDRRPGTMGSNHRRSIPHFVMKKNAIKFLALCCLVAVGLQWATAPSGYGLSLPLTAHSANSAIVADANLEACGEKVFPVSFYENLSLYSLIAGFAFVILGILLDKKSVKYGFFGVAILPLAVWAYVHFGIDFERINRLTFNYNATAEQTLANIAEAQDRYKSEHDTFLTDLDKLDSHMAGAHGIDPCIKILKIEATWNFWSAEAQHVSSPGKVTWDSKTGSSLKKG